MTRLRIIARFRGKAVEVIGLVTDLWRDAKNASPGYIQGAYTRADSLIEAIIARHRPIQKMFFMGVGLSLQRMDSDIAQAVMREMRRRGVVVLPVHDSFIAPASKASVLEGVMLNEAAKAGVVLKCKCS